MSTFKDIILKPIWVKSGKIGTYQAYKDYGMQICTLLNAKGGIVKTGMTPSGDRLYPNLTKILSESGFIGHELPIVRDNPDVALDATGNYPGYY